MSSGTGGTTEVAPSGTHQSLKILFKGPHARLRPKEPHHTLTCAAHTQAHENVVPLSRGNAEAMGS